MAILDAVSKEKMQEIFDSSFSYTEALSKLGYTSFSANRKTIERKIVEYSINLELFENNRCLLKKKNETRFISNSIRLTSEDLLVENCIHGRKEVRKFILRNKIIEYKCCDCGNTGEWNGKKLSLQLDHKNGINNDNRKENLRFLCPNCHSQTPTWGSKRLNKSYGDSSVKVQHTTL